MGGDCGGPLTNLIVVEVVEALEGEVLLLDLLDDLFRKLPELAQRRHGLPPEGNTTVRSEKLHLYQAREQNTCPLYENGRVIRDVFKLKMSSVFLLIKYTIKNC